MHSLRVIVFRYFFLNFVLPFFVISGPFVSALSNRYGFRVVTISGAIMAATSLAVSSFAPSIEFLFISVGVFGGIGFGVIFLPAVVAVGYYFDKKRALATGIAVCGSGVGTFILAPFTAFLLEEYGWRGTMLIQVTNSYLNERIVSGKSDPSSSSLPN